MLVVVESPIDAMAHFQMQPPERRSSIRYAAIRQGFNPEDLRAIIKALPVGATVVAGCDADTAGEKYNAVILEVAQAEGRSVTVSRPKTNDWNADLLALAEDHKDHPKSHFRRK